MIQLKQPGFFIPKDKNEFDFVNKMAEDNGWEIEELSNPFRMYPIITTQITSPKLIFTNNDWVTSVGMVIIASSGDRKYYKEYELWEVIKDISENKVIKLPKLQITSEYEMVITDEGLEIGCQHITWGKWEEIKSFVNKNKPKLL